MRLATSLAALTLVPSAQTLKPAEDPAPVLPTGDLAGGDADIATDPCARARLSDAANRPTAV